MYTCSLKLSGYKLYTEYINLLHRVTIGASQIQRWPLSFIDSLTFAFLFYIQGRVIFFFSGFIGDQRSKEFACVEAMTTFQVQCKISVIQTVLIFSLLALSYP